MPRFIPISWRKFEKFLIFVGCEFEREKGDHRIFWRKGLSRPIVFPREKELPLFVIRNNLRVLGIDRNEFLEIINRMK